MEFNMKKKPVQATTAAASSSVSATKFPNEEKANRFKAAELLRQAMLLINDSNSEFSDSEDELNAIDECSRLEMLVAPCSIEDVKDEEEHIPTEGMIEGNVLGRLLNMPVITTFKRFKLATSELTSTASLTANTPGLKYAPVMRINSGTYDLYPISLAWTDDNGASTNQLRIMANEVNSIISRLSYGAIKFNVKAPTIYRTGHSKDAKDVNEASDKARNLVTDRASQNQPRYIIVNNRAKGFSHSGGQTASVLTPLITTAGHEVLHTLGLGHANRYAISTKGKNKGKLELQSSRDGSSIMSIYSSSNLTAPQKYSQGWYQEQQVAMYEIGDPTVTYNLQLVCDDPSRYYLNAVFIPREGRPPLFLSLFDTKANNQGIREKFLVLNVGVKGGGSTRLQSFGQHAEMDGMSFDTVAKGNDFWTVRVGPAI